MVVTMGVSATPSNISGVSISIRSRMYSSVSVGGARDRVGGDERDGRK